MGQAFDHKTTYTSACDLQVLTFNGIYSHFQT